MFLYQAANLAGFRASEDPRFEAGIPDFMNGILNFSIDFNVVHRKVDWRNPKMKSLNSMPVYIGCIDWVGWRLARGEDGRGWST